MKIMCEETIDKTKTATQDKMTAKNCATGLKTSSAVE